LLLSAARANGTLPALTHDEFLRLEQQALPVAAELKALGHKISFHSGLSAAMARRQDCGRILMYHGVVEQEAQALTAQLYFLARHFKAVSLETMVDRLANNAAQETNEIVLTFDDGLRNNLSVVYPILRKLQLPATFFVCPELIETEAWLWNNEARCRLQTLSAPALSDLSKSLLAPDDSSERIIEWMKTLPLQQRREAEKIINRATAGFQPTSAQHAAFDMMNWHDLRSLDPRLITVGSHTMSHPILTTLSEQQIENELTESRHSLERHLQRPIDFFCYPNGSYDERAYEMAKKTYRAALTTENGVVHRHESLDLHRLPRIPSAENAALTAWRLHRPGA
jgi:peptidoglycan/xylan/chitin deacetylase (PgdA/CDA1 family)